MNANKQIYDENWLPWRDMKLYGPASMWLRWLIRECLAALDRPAIGTILDVGCGEGTTTAMISREFPQAMVTGIDFSEAGIALAHRTYSGPRLSFVKDEGSDLLPPESYDLVACFEVLEHVDDWQSLLRRICAASTRSVVLSFPTGRMRGYEPHVGHVRNFAAGEVEAFMRARGYESARIFNAGFPFYSPLYRDLCNVADAGRNPFSRGRFGWARKAVGACVYALFRYLSLRTVGDQFCGVFTRTVTGPQRTAPAP